LPQRVSIGLVGDHDPSVTAHRAIPLALRACGQSLGTEVAPTWLPTDAIQSTAACEGFDGLWCVPASPYRSMAGALLAIRHAREQRVPFLGTCGGFQHAVLEYARNVLGWADAEHAETAPDAARTVVAPLACSLVEVSDAVHLLPGTRIAAAYGASQAREGYHCRYGINPDFREALMGGALNASALDPAGDVRAVEFDGHPFFVATLFQPERAALQGQVPPLVQAFVRVCVDRTRPSRACGASIR
jgi:CTP synthase (UTP-ammonia lyase)